MSRRAWLYGLLVLGAVLFAYSDLLGARRVPVYRDLLPFVYPYRAFLADHISRGELPLWNPHVQLGVPFLASLHASALYPLSLLLVIPFPLGFNCFLLAHYLLAAGGFALFLRARGIVAAPMAVGLVTFTVGGYLASSLTNTAHLQAAAWIPWLLLVWDRHARSRDDGSLLIMILLSAVQVCAGAPEVWMLTVALLAARSLAIPALRLPRRAALVGRLLVVVAVGTVLSAIQVLPTLEYVSESRRLGMLDWREVTYWSVEPVSLLQFLFPHSSSLIGPHETGTVGTYLETTAPLIHSLYIGILGLVLAIVGATASRERLFWGMVALVTFSFTLGPGSPVFEVARTVAPMIVARIRYPEKALVLFHLALAVLAADGAAAVIGKRCGALRLSAVTALVFAVVTGGVVAVGFLEPGRLSSITAVLTGRGDLPIGAFRLLAIDLAYKAERSFLLSSLWLTLALLYYRERLTPWLFSSLLVIVLAVDLTSVHRSLAPSVTVEALAETTPIVDVADLRSSGARLFHYQRQIEGAAIPGLAQRRPPIYTQTDLRDFARDQWRSLYLDLGMVHGVGTLSGWDSIGDLVSLERAVAGLPLSRAIRLLGTYHVRELVGGEPIRSPEVFPVRTVGDLRVYRLRRSMPSAFLVSELEVASDEDVVFSRLAHPAFPRERRAFVDQAPPGWQDAGALEPEEGVAVETVSNEESRFRVSSGHNRFLVVNQRYYPGWVADRDGQPVKIHRANALVCGIVVPAGDHVVRLRYQPSSVRTGLGVTLITASVLAVVLLWRRRRGLGRPLA